jgi:glucokinase
MSEVVGVDLGGTKLAVARLRDGWLRDSVVEPTNRSSATALIDQLDELVERVRSHATSAVGIGVASVVEFETGRVVSSVKTDAPSIDTRARRPTSQREDDCHQ